MSSASGRPPAAIPPQRRGNNAVWWILGIVAGGIVVMVLFGLALAGLFIRNLRVHNQGNNVEIQTPVGAIKVNKDAPRASGLPVYPGAKSAGDDDNAAFAGLVDGEATVNAVFTAVGGPNVTAEICAKYSSLSPKRLSYSLPRRPKSAGNG